MNNRPYRPIFTATITPGTVERGTAANGKKFTTMRNTVVAKNGETIRTCTVMAFGQSNAAVARRLRAGRPLTVAVQHDGATMRVIGWARKPEAEVAAAA